MSALKSLQIALELATRQRDDSGRAMVEERRLCMVARDQLEQLESYFRETRDRWALGARTSASAETMRHCELFMQRLQQATGLQQSAVAQRERELEAARRRLLAAEIRIASLQKLLARRRSSASRQDARRVQKELDEFAALQQRRLQSTIQTMGTL